MPRASARQKQKGGIMTTPKNVAATVKSLRRCAEAHQTAVKFLVNRKRQKKGTEEARVQLAIANSNLEEAKLDVEAILRQAERSSMQTKSLKEAIEFAANSLSAVSDAPAGSNANVPPNPNPKSKIAVSPDLSTVAEGEEEEDAAASNPVPAELEKRPRFPLSNTNPPEPRSQTEIQMRTRWRAKAKMKTSSRRRHIRE